MSIKNLLVSPTVFHTATIYGASHHQSTNSAMRGTSHDAIMFGVGIKKNQIKKSL
jgi:hypothetical protein